MNKILPFRSRLPLSHDTVRLAANSDVNSDPGPDPDLDPAGHPIEVGLDLRSQRRAWCRARHCDSSQLLTGELPISKPQGPPVGTGT